MSETETNEPDVEGEPDEAEEEVVETEETKTTRQVRIEP